MEIVEIEDVKFHKNSVILKLKGINDLNTAETLKELFIKSRQAKCSKAS